MKKKRREFFIRCRVDSRQGGEGYKEKQQRKKVLFFSFYLPHGLTKQQQQNNPTGIESNIPSHIRLLLLRDKRS
jgi:hypothetical protein